jgi:glycosyltransferase involved in cell wall biosynthesis
MPVMPLLATVDSRSTEGCAEAFLLLAYYFPPLNESGAQRPFRFAKYLSRCGYSAHIVTASTPGAVPPWPDVTYVPGHGAGGGAATLAAKALQRALPYDDRLPWAPRACAAAARIIEQKRISMLISTSPPLAIQIAALYLKRRYGLKWIADLRDPIYGNPFRPARLARWYDLHVERQVIAAADAVIANTDRAVAALRNRHPEYGDKIHLLWNGFDPEEPVGPLPLPLRTHKVLLHSGAIYGPRHPGVLLKSIERLVSSGALAPDRLQVHLMGSVDWNQSWVSDVGFQSLVAESWIQCTGEVLPRADARRAMAMADYLLLLDTETGNGQQVPAKLFEYILIGRPILAFTNPGSATESILSRSGIPHACISYQAEPAQVDRVLRGFLELPSEPVRPSAWFAEQFDAEKQTQTLLSILGTCRTERKP